MNKKQVLEILKNLRYTCMTCDTLEIKDGDVEALSFAINALEDKKISPESLNQEKSNVITIKLDATQFLDKLNELILFRNQNHEIVINSKNIKNPNEIQADVKKNLYQFEKKL